MSPKKQNESESKAHLRVFKRDACLLYMPLFECL